MSRMFVCVTLVALITACGDDGHTGRCEVASNTGCGDGQVCEEVSGGEPTCFAPLVVEGRVLDFETTSGIGDASVVAIDANGSAVSAVAVSASSGSYALTVPTARATDGTPVLGKAITLRADAAGYLTFPSGVRPALPIDTSAPALVDGRYVVRSALTDVALLPLPPGPATGMIHGRAAANASSASRLIVAETGSQARGLTAIADRDGDYRIFNVPPGSYTVNAYARGYNYTARTVEVGGGQDVEVDLEIDRAGASAVSGSVSIVNPQEGEATSVILVVESTFNEALVRGESPPGLRAPSPGTLPNVDGAFAIEGVPAGRYVVLAAFENDFLVRDASGGGGTEIVHQVVTAGQDVQIGESFKVTGSLDIIGPGANGPEMVTSTPTFRWIDDSSEDRYDLTVFDARGTAIWTYTDRSGAADPAVTYAGPALQSGMYYQFRVLSIKDPDEELSRTEDLKGVFFVP